MSSAILLCIFSICSAISISSNPRSTSRSSSSASVQRRLEFSSCSRAIAQSSSIRSLASWNLRSGSCSLSSMKPSRFRSNLFCKSFLTGLLFSAIDAAAVTRTHTIDRINIFFHIFLPPILTKACIINTFEINKGLMLQYDSIDILLLSILYSLHENL